MVREITLTTQNKNSFSFRALALLFLQRRRVFQISRSIISVTFSVKGLPADGGHLLVDIRDATISSILGFRSTANHHHPTSPSNGSPVDRCHFVVRVREVSVRFVVDFRVFFADLSLSNPSPALGCVLFLLGFGVSFAFRARVLHRNRGAAMAFPVSSEPTPHRVGVGAWRG